MARSWMLPSLTKRKHCKKRRERSALRLRELAVMKTVAAWATLKRRSFRPKTRPDQRGRVMKASREGLARGM